LTPLSSIVQQLHSQVEDVFAMEAVTLSPWPVPCTPRERHVDFVIFLLLILLQLLANRWMCFHAAEEIVSRFTSFYFVEPQANDLERYAKNETNGGDGLLELL
jgi:uncharacterized membrane protein